MTMGRALTAPFFEIGPKNLLRLPEVLSVAAAATGAGRRHGVSVILTVPTAFIASVRAATPDAFVFAQGMSPDEPGTSVGRDIAEALSDAGADGVMLNHDENPLDRATLGRAIRRAHDNALMTMVCAGEDSEVLGLAEDEPTIVLYEPPSLIGGAGGQGRPWIPRIDALMREAAPRVLMMHAGGVSAPDDAYAIMRAGAGGTGSTSGVLRSASPAEAAEEFIAAARRGYDDHGG